MRENRDWGSDVYARVTVEFCGTSSSRIGSRMILLLACSTPTFIEALEGDAGMCADLEAEGERGECATAHAVVLAKAGDRAGAFALCEPITDDWHDECVFRTSDALKLEGDDAFQACQSAGRYEDQCAGHAATRMVAAMDDLPLEVGQELELIDAIDARVAAWPVKHRATVNRTGVTRHIADRFDGTFDVALCGELPTELCRLSYAETMRQDASLDREVLCAKPRTSPTVQAAGGTAWTAASNSIVQAALNDLCGSWAGDAPRPMGPGHRR